MHVAPLPLSFADGFIPRDIAQQWAFHRKLFSVFIDYGQPRIFLLFTRTHNHWTLAPLGCLHTQSTIVSRPKKPGGCVAKDLFYLPTYKNVGTLFDKIESAKAPEAFTTRFLSDTIGLKSAGDRALINMLKKMGFLDTGGRPTDAYGLLKNKDVAATAVADGLRQVYKPLFDANERANELPLDQLKGLIAQVTGSEKNTVAQIAYTFNSIAKKADFAKKGTPEPTDTGKNGKEAPPGLPATGLRTDFHFNIQVHLPANGSEETYLNIFNALRRTFS